MTGERWVKYHLPPATYHYCSSIITEVRTVPTFFCSSSKFSLMAFQFVHISSTQYCNPFLPCPATLLRTFFPYSKYPGFVTIPSDSPLLTALLLLTWKLCTLNWDCSTLFFQEARILLQYAAILDSTLQARAMWLFPLKIEPNYSLLVFF